MHARTHICLYTNMHASMLTHEALTVELAKRNVFKQFFLLLRIGIYILAKF